jgi:glycosyltransferase involved in cell wall biosynthesis
MRDVWIDAYYDKNRSTLVRYLCKLLHIYEKAIVNNATEIVVIGQSMARYIQKKYMLKKRPVCIFNATAHNCARRRINTRNWNDLKKSLSDMFVIGFIGNLNNAYDIDVIINAAELLRLYKCLFLFVGNGSQKFELMRKVDFLNLEYFRFFDAVPASEVGFWFELCDATIIPLRSGDICHIYLPVKIFDSMAASRSVLLGGEGEAKRIIETSGAGQVFEPGDSFGLCEMIKERMSDREILEKEGKAGKDFVFKHFTRERMAEKYIDVMRNIVNGGNRENADDQK